MGEPVQVLYCKVCTLPAEYCEFRPDFDKCKPWLITNAPQLYPQLIENGAGDKRVDNVSQRLQSTGISDGPAGTLGESSSSSKPEVKQRLPGGKTKKKEKQEVIIEKVVRNERKCITTVKGLEFSVSNLVMLQNGLGKNSPLEHLLLRDQLTRSILMFKETLHMMLWAL